MHTFTEIPSIDSELSIVYGRLDSLFPEGTLSEVHADAADNLDAIEQSGANEEVSGLSNLKDGLIDSIQDRIAELTGSDTEFSLGGLAVYRFASSDGLSVYITRDSRKITDHTPRYVRFAGIMVSHVLTDELASLSDYEAVPPEHRADQHFSLLRPTASDGSALVTYHIDDQAYQFLLDREHLSPMERAFKMQQQIELAKEVARTELDFSASQAGVSKVIELNRILNQNLTPFEYSSKIREGLRIIRKLIPPTE